MPRDELEQRGVFTDVDNTEDSMIDETKKEVVRRPNRIGKKSIGAKVAELGIKGSRLAGAAVALHKEITEMDKLRAAKIEALRSILRAEATK
jgi:hypothetical protein